MYKFKKISILFIALFLILFVFLVDTRNIAFTSENIDTDVNISYEMEVHFIDIGQGDCILVESQNQYMLIDTGVRNKKDVLISYLKNQGISKIDYLIGTHPHGDHIGSMDIIVKEFNIDKIFLPEKEHTTKIFERLIDVISDKGLKITRPIVGDTYPLGSSIFTIVAPNNDYGDNINNWSIGIKLTNKNNSFLFTGDIEKEAEHDICNNDIDISADVLKLPHHGSRTSTTKEFFNLVNPEFAIVMCEEGNDYGHPHQEILDKLKNVKVIRTDEAGTVVFYSDGDNLSYTTEKTVKLLNSTKPSKKKYVLNKNTKKFHYNSCISVKKSSRKNKEVYIGFRSEVIDMGYTPCGNCRP